MGSSDPIFQVEVVPAPRPDFPPQIVVFHVDKVGPLEVSRRVYALPDDPSYDGYQAVHRASHDYNGAPAVMSEHLVVTGYPALEETLCREISEATGVRGDATELFSHQIILVIRDDLSGHPGTYL